MQLSGIRLSVCLSACLSVQSGRRTPLLRVCCCGPGGQEISIDCCSSGGRLRAVARCQRSSTVHRPPNLCSSCLAVLYLVVRRAVATPGRCGSRQQRRCSSCAEIRRYTSLHGPRTRILHHTTNKQTLSVCFASFL